MTSHNIAAGCAAKGSLRVPIIAVCNNLLARAHDTGSGLRVFIPLWQFAYIAVQLELHTAELFIWML